MNHDKCEQLGRVVLQHFKQEDVRRYSVGGFDGDWETLIDQVDAWWDAHQEWAKQDTLADAYKEQRLIVKGTSEMNTPIQAQTRPMAPKLRHAKDEDWGASNTFGTPIVKTNASIQARMNPKVFVPDDGAPSRKTELGYHDLSALLLNPLVHISKQQYKTPEDGQLYVFLPLSPALEQAVFQNINTLAKASARSHEGFYTRVRQIRSEMTRIKLAAEHDMAVAFIKVGVSERTNLPKFKYSLISTTDISVNDELANVEGVPKDTFECKLTVPRFEDALKTLNLSRSDREDLRSRLQQAQLFNQPLLPQAFRDRVEAAVKPKEAKSKWTRVEPLPEGVVRGKERILEAISPKTKQTWPTTPGIRQARQTAAINYQSLVLGKIMRYGEVTVAYRKHPGTGDHQFPKFAKFNEKRSLWEVGTVNIDNVWSALKPEQTFPDRPA